MAKLTGEDLKQFNKDLAELNRLRAEVNKSPLKIDADSSQVIAIKDELDSIREIINDLDGTVEGLSIQWRNVLEEVKETNQAQKLGVGSLNKLRDISDKIRLSQKGINELSSKELRSLANKTKIEFENLELTKKMLQASGENADLLAEIESQLKDNTSAYNTQLNTINKMAKQQLNIERATGLTGVALKGIQGFLNKIGMGDMATVFEDASEAAKSTASRLTDGGKKAGGLLTKVKAMGSAFKVIGKEILRNLTDPLILATMAIKGATSAFNFLKKKYEEGKQAAVRISEENVNISRTLGLAQGAANQLAAAGAKFGPTIAAGKESISSIYQAMDSTEKLTANTVKTFVKLNTFAGVSAESLAKFQKFAKLSGQDAGTLVKNMAQVSLDTIKTNKYAFSQKSLLNDVANVSSTIRLQFRDQPKLLVESVAKAKALGIEMSKMEDIGQSLLNFEDSIAAEMEAELLTGKQLNLEKAREAALRGDTAALQDEIINQLGSIEEFQNMNVIQQEAFAKSVGLSRGELAGMLDAQEGSKSINGDLVEGQQDGIAAMSSQVSLAEKHANIERASQEANMKYYKSLEPLVTKLQEIWTKIQSIVSNLINDNVLKPMIEWATGPAGTAFLDSLPDRAQKFADGIKSAATSISNFVKEHPWLMKAMGWVAGGALVIKGAKGLMSMFGLKRDGSSKSNALFVQLAGAADSITDPIKNLFKKNQGTKPTIKTGVDKRGRKFSYDSATGKRVSPKGGGAKGGGGLFGGLKSMVSNVGKSISNSKVGKFVSNTTKSISQGASNLKNFANPMTYIKKYMPKIMDSKGFKKVVSSIPKIGKIASLAMIAYDLISQGAGISAATKQGVGPQDIGKQIVMALGDVGGSIIGGALGSLIPVPGVGTLLGTFLGGLGGSALAGLIADNTDVSGIGNWAIKALGGPKDGGSAEDFILQDGKMTKFRKDDVIVGGTNLGGGDNGKTIQLLERLVAAVEKGGTIILDGQKVGTAMVAGNYRMQ